LIGETVLLESVDFFLFICLTIILIQHFQHIFILLWQQNLRPIIQQLTLVF